MRYRRALICLTVLAVLSASCGYYSTSSRTAGDIKKIAIPYLKNETPEPEIELEITDKIIEGIIKDNTLEVVTDSEAEAILEGSIVDYQNVPFTFNKRPDETDIQAEQYRLLIGLRISLFNRGENTYIWENKLIRAHGDYYLEADSERDYAHALEEVYREIVESILSTTIQEW
jgi:hypothetical protein